MTNKKWTRFRDNAGEIMFLGAGIIIGAISTGDLFLHVLGWPIALGGLLGVFVGEYKLMESGHG